MLPNLQALQVFYGTIPLIGAFLIAVWTNNKRIDDMGKRIDDMGKRIDDLRQDLTAHIEALAIRLDNKIDGLGKRLIDRIERLERPLLRG